MAQDGAIYLDGVSGLGTAAGVGDLVSNSTWEAWVRLPNYSGSNSDAGCILFRWGMWSHGLYVREDTGAPFIGMYSCPGPDGCSTSPAGSMVPGRWHHIAAVFGPEPGPSGSLYIDGQLVAACPPLGCDPYAGWETVLGAQGYIGYSQFFRGEIDEARISAVPRYSGSFTPERRFAPDSATVGLWHFDEGSGSVAYDSSAAGRHFSLSGGYEWRGGVTAITPYCQPKVTSAGCTPVLSHLGQPSCGGNEPFTLRASQIAPGVHGILVWSKTPAALPFAGGTFCVTGTTGRSVILPAMPPGGPDCSGVLDFAFTPTRVASFGLAPGDIVHFQIWTRDNGYAAPDNWGMTAGLRVTMLP